MVNNLKHEFDRNTDIFNFQEQNITETKNENKALQIQDRIKD